MLPLPSVGRLGWRATFRMVPLLLAGLCLGPVAARAQTEAETPPTSYELMINGESFQVEANRIVKLESKEKAGVVYEVALRVAPTQRVRMDTFQFDYDLPARLRDDRGQGQRTARLTHEMGFTMLLGDLGGAMDDEGRRQALDILIESVAETYREMKVEGLDVGKPHERKFGENSARGVVIRYKDAQQFGHTSLVYVLQGANFTASCVVQYLDHDSEDALPLVKRILESVAPLS